MPATLPPRPALSLSKGAAARRGCGVLQTCSAATHRRPSTMPGAPGATPPKATRLSSCSGDISAVWPQASAPETIHPRMRRCARRANSGLRNCDLPPSWSRSSSVGLTAIQISIRLYRSSAREALRINLAQTLCLDPADYSHRTGPALHG